MHGVPGAVQCPEGEGVEPVVPAAGEAADRRPPAPDLGHLRQRRRGGLRRHLHLRPAHPIYDSRQGPDARDRADVPRRRRVLARPYPRGGAPPDLSRY